MHAPSRWARAACQFALGTRGVPVDVPLAERPDVADVHVTLPERTC